MPVIVITCRDYIYDNRGRPDYSRGKQTFISHGVDTETLKNVITDNELFETARRTGQVVFNPQYGWVFRD